MGSSPALACVATVLVLVAAVAGCAEPPQAARTIPLLRLVVEVAANTTFAVGEVLGSEQGTRIDAFRFDDDAKTILASVPDGASHLYVVNRTGEPAVLVADATRATAGARGSDLPAIIEFKPVGEDFALNVVQPGNCGAIVNNRDNVTEGKGPFTVPPLRALPAGSREFVVFALTGQGGSDCAVVKVEAENLGRWTLLSPPER